MRKMLFRNQEGFTLIEMIAVLVILIALAFLINNLRPHSAKTNYGPFIGLGQVLAGETAKLVQDHGRVAVILPEGYQTAGLAVQEEWQAFGAELAKHPGVHLLGREIVGLAVLAESGLTSSQADDILKKYDGVDVLVSFCGIPSWNPANPAARPRNLPKIVAVESSSAQIKDYLASGIVAAVITPRVPPRATPAKPQTPAEWFDRSFQLYTTANYQSLSDSPD